MSSELDSGGVPASADDDALMVHLNSLRARFAGETSGDDDDAAAWDNMKLREVRRRASSLRQSERWVVANPTIAMAPPSLASVPISEELRAELTSEMEAAEEEVRTATLPLPPVAPAGPHSATSSLVSSPAGVVLAPPSGPMSGVVGLPPRAPSPKPPHVATSTSVTDLDAQRQAQMVVDMQYLRAAATSGSQPGPGLSHTFSIAGAMPKPVPKAHPLAELLERNVDWVERMTQHDPRFFSRMAVQQTPQYMWIGCSDSRVPANQVVGLLPGEIFVHRNVANLVVHTDLNCLSAIEYAVDVLKVKHILVVGHRYCGGVAATLKGDRVGLVDNWLRHVEDVRRKYEKRFQLKRGAIERLNVLCALNVIEQVENVAWSTVLRDAWGRGQDLTVHGWLFGIDDGLIRDLIAVSSIENVASGVVEAVDRLYTDVVQQEQEQPLSPPKHEHSATCGCGSHP